MLMDILKTKGQPGRNHTGASLTLIMGFVVGLLVLIGLFAFNYARILGSQREGQTAIDAAALEAAKQASSVFVASNVGSVGLVDQPADPATGRPTIIGINTALATARLDALIAQDIGNNAMLMLAQRDMNELNNVVLPNLINQVNAQLQSAAVVASVRNVYLRNANRNFRNANGANTNANTITITYGTFRNNQSSTNIRTPGLSSTGVDDGFLNGNNSVGNLPNRFYRPNVAIASPAGNIVLGSSGDNPRIVDNAGFAAGAGGLVPTAVQVAATSTLTDGGTTNGNVLNANLRNVATAVCGATIVSPTSSTYCISFASGFPPGATFDSAANMMNGVGGGNPVPIPGNGAIAGIFGPVPAQSWFRAPNAGSIPPGPMVASGFNGINSQVRARDFPPTALSFGIYDWVRSLGLRTDRRTMEMALTANLRTFVNATNYNNPVQFAWDGFSAPAYAATAQPSQQNAAWMALSSDPNQDPRYQALVHMDSNPNGIRNVVNSFGYALASAVAPRNAAAVTVTASTVQTTDGRSIRDLGDLQNGISRTNHAAECVKQAAQQVYTIQDAAATNFHNQKDAALAQAAADRNSANSMRNQAAQLTAQAGRTTPANASLLAQAQNLQAQAANMDQQATTKTNEASQAAAQEATARAKEALASKCLANAGHVMDQTFAVMNSFNSLTALGVTKLTDKTYRVAGSIFTAHDSTNGDNSYLDHPTATQISNFQQVITNASGATDATLATSGGASWADNTLSSYTHTGVPVTIARGIPRGDFMTAPAYAQIAGAAAPPNNNLMFLINIQGDYQQNRSANVTITPLPLSPFMANSTISGQAHYVAPGAINTPINGVNVSWTVQARDLVANGRFFNKAAAASATNPTYCANPQFNMNLNLGAGQTCPSLGGEFRIGCPVPGGCVGTSQVLSNGSLSVTPCPPPPPQMG